MSDHTSHIAEAKRLERSDSDRMLYGVAGGLARYFDIHPAFFRVGFVVLTLLGGSGLLIYAAAALVMPAEGAADSVATRALRQRRDRPWPLIGLGLLAVAGAVLLSNASFWPHGDVWIVLAIAGVAILVLTRHGLPDPRAGSTRPSRSHARTPAGCAGSSRASESPSPPSSRCSSSRPRSPRRSSTSTSGTGSATARSR
jgi:phage shock protein PspC (stress-responsive transcriptional regulator)